MSNQKELERSSLHATIWKIANDLRGSVDGWDFNLTHLQVLPVYRLGKKLLFKRSELESVITKEEPRGKLWPNLANRQSLLSQSQQFVTHHRRMSSADEYLLDRRKKRRG